MKIQLSLKESSTAGSVYSAPSMYSAEQLQPSDEELAQIDKEEKEREEQQAEKDREEAAKKAKEKESKPQKTDAEKDGDDSDDDSGDDEDDEDTDEEDDEDDSGDESDDDESDDEDEESDDDSDDDESDDEDDSDDDSDEDDSDDEEATASSLIANVPGKIRIPFPEVEAYKPEDDAPESKVPDRDEARTEQNLAETSENADSNEGSNGKELAQASSAPLTYPDVFIKPV